MLDQFVAEKALGEVRYAPLDVVLGEENVVQPDLLFISKARKKIIRKEEIRGAPEEYWLVDPDEKTIEVLELGRRGFERVALYKKADTLSSPLLPGLKIPLCEVF